GRGCRFEAQTQLTYIRERAARLEATTAAVAEFDAGSTFADIRQLRLGLFVIGFGLSGTNGPALVVECREFGTYAFIRLARIGKLTFGAGLNRLGLLDRVMIRMILRLSGRLGMGGRSTHGARLPVLQLRGQFSG